MIDTLVAANWRSARLVAVECVDVVWRSLGKPWRCVKTLAARTPERLLIAPQDIRTNDPTIAADMYAGYFAFAGKIVNSHGQSPFQLSPPSPGWAASLVSFIWLRHLRGADTALARANARALVDDFIAHASDNPALPVWEPRVAARRLLSWLSQSPMILDGADRDFYRRFMKALGRHAAKLECALGNGARGETRLLIAIALAELGLCAAEMGALQRRATNLLAFELNRQILPDGGHIGRNPQTLIDLLLDLLPLRQAYAARGVAAPPALLNAIDRMLPMLRLFRLGDGSLALFNGMGVTQAHSVATVLAYDDARAAAAVNAPHSGYQRLESNGAVLVMDTGAPPPYEFSQRAHAGQLSFELSSDGQPFIINCGAPDESRVAIRAAARATAAHSTLTIEDTSSSHFCQGGSFMRHLEGRIIAGPRKVTVERQDTGEGPGLTASHDGYKREFGLIHQRALRLSADGADLIGVDRLAPAGPPSPDGTARNYAIRFHLHPALQTVLTDDSRSVMLTLPDGAQWIFRADGLRIEVEPSICFATAGAARGTDQIVVQANSGEIPVINWSFQRQSS